MGSAFSQLFSNVAKVTDRQAQAASVPPDTAATSRTRKREREDEGSDDSKRCKTAIGSVAEDCSRTIHLRNLPGVDRAAPSIGVPAAAASAASIGNGGENPEDRHEAAAREGATERFGNNLCARMAVATVAANICLRDAPLADLSLEQWRGVGSCFELLVPVLPINLREEHDYCRRQQQLHLALSMLQSADFELEHVGELGGIMLRLAGHDDKEMYKLLLDCRRQKHSSVSGLENIHAEEKYMYNLYRFQKQTIDLLQKLSVVLGIEDGNDNQDLAGPGREDGEPLPAGSLLALGDPLVDVLSFLPSRDLCRSGLACKTFKRKARLVIDGLVKDVNEACDRMPEASGTRTKLIRYFEQSLSALSTNKAASGPVVESRFW